MNTNKTTQVRTSNRSVRLPAVLSVLAAATLVFSGCSSSKGSGQSGDAGAGEPEPSAIEVGEYFVHPTDVVVDGLVGQRIASSTGIAARWAYLPGEQPFNEYVAEQVAPHFENQAASRNAAYFPEAHDPSPEWLERGCIAGSTNLSGREILDDPALSGGVGADTVLAVACDSVLASGSNYAEKIRFVRGNSTEVVSDLVEIVYTNTETGEVAKGRELISEQGVQDLYDATYEAVGVERPMSGDEVLAPTAEDLDDFHSSLSNVGVDADGYTYVTVDQNEIAILAAGDSNVEIAPLTLVIPADRAHLNLTDLGQEISRSMAAGEEWSGPAAVPAGQQFVDCELSPCLAVTYDDGPSYLTPSVLDAYAELPYAALTFFVLGGSIGGQEEILARAHNEGHEIGNHSWSHPAFTTLDDAAITQELTQTSDAIAAATGEAPVLYRPPYGDLNDRTLAAAGMPSVLWSLDTNDWQHPGQEALVADVVTNSQPDDIVLMHDIHEDTVGVAGQIGEQLVERGFTLVTVSQLIRGLEVGPVMLTSAGEFRS